MNHFNLHLDNCPKTTREADWITLREFFPVVEKYIYFNHAAIAPLSSFVKDSMNACNEKFCKEGIVCNREFLDIVQDTRKMAAELINANPSEITFVKNTTQGLHIAANGIRWEKGDNVLIPENEFPANVYPWLNLSKKGVETRFIPLTDNKFHAEDIARYIDNRTRAVSVSAVSFTNGFRCNLEKIGQLCKEKDIIFIVDAIQAIGAIDMDIKKTGIDILSADAHKWLLGPQGIGFAFISEKILETLEVSNLGYKSMTEENDYLNYKIRLKPDANRFEEGTLNILGITGLHASLKMLLSIGIKNVEKRIKDLNSLLMDELIRLGYLIHSPESPEQRSGILSFSHPIVQTEKIYKDLIEEGVVCAVRGGALRISPHCYNNQDDIDNFLNVLP